MAGTHVGANLGSFPAFLGAYIATGPIFAPDPLKAEIKEAVCASKFLIVCCSAHSSQSKWVQEEINLFPSPARSQSQNPAVSGGI